MNLSELLFNLSTDATNVSLLIVVLLLNWILMHFLSQMSSLRKSVMNTLFYIQQFIACTFFVCTLQSTNEAFVDGRDVIIVLSWFTLFGCLVVIWHSLSVVRSTTKPGLLV